jgi:23S rRNA pseudouridine1911/1915/1917 synthase
VKIETGRTHQIRVHCASQGYPVVGDQVYGRVSKLIARQALHAARIAFDHPASGERLTFEARLPDDMAHALEALRAGRDDGV